MKDEAAKSAPSTSYLPKEKDKDKTSAPSDKKPSPSSSSQPNSSHSNSHLSNLSKPLSSASGFKKDITDKLGKDGKLWTDE